MAHYLDCWGHSRDGLRLYARDYGCEPAPFPVLCMHGLTRNSADFADLADTLDGRYRLVAIDQRGRGRSDHDPNSANYNVSTYVADTFDFLNQHGIADTVLVGTSMGGIIAMAMAASLPGQFRGVILNDIGPAVDPAGLERIRGYAGKGEQISSWSDAVTVARDINGAAFPDWNDEQWLKFARKTFVEDSQGDLQFAYDPAISHSMTAGQLNAALALLWPLFDQIVHIPTLVIRGAHSDILSPGTLAEMAKRHHQFNAVEVPNRGHAPTLSEPVARDAINEFLRGLERAPLPDTQEATGKRVPLARRQPARSLSNHRRIAMAAEP